MTLIYSLRIWANLWAGCKSKGNIKCIPKNKEKYISFGKEVVAGLYINKEDKEAEVEIELCFINSFRCMPSFLEKLVILVKVIQDKPRRS